MSDQIDAIINRILVEERLKDAEVVVTPVPIIKYHCDSEHYGVEYNEATEVAIYTIDANKQTIKTDIPLKQRNYYVDSGYWKLC
jgi:hypothetical protein